MNNTTSEKNTAVFRTSLSGFNKEDVNNYIIRMNREFREKEADYRDEIEQINADALGQSEKLKTEISDLKAVIVSVENNKVVLESKAKAADESAKKLEIENTLLKAKCESLERSLAEAVRNQPDDTMVSSIEIENITTRYEQEVETLRYALASETEKISACEKIISEQRELIDSMKEERDSLIMAKAGAEETSKLLSEQIQAMTTGNNEKDEVVEKSQLYDQISRQVGDILINASKTSDEIIDRANVRAHEIIEEAENTADERKEFIEDTADEILRKFRKEMNFAAEQCFAEISTSLTEIQYDTSALLAEIEKRNRELAEKILHHKSNLADSLKENIHILDKKIISGDSTGI